MSGQNAKYFEVSLTWPQVMLAANLGVLRHIEAIFGNQHDKPGVGKDNGWTLHIEGAAAEMAFARAASVFFPATLNDSKNPDVGQVQVRNRYRHDYELPFRAGDDPKWPYVLVTGKIPDFRVWGWLYGHEIQRPEWWKDPGEREAPAYFAPHSALRSLSELPSEMLLPYRA